MLLGFLGFCPHRTLTRILFGISMLATFAPSHAYAKAGVFAGTQLGFGKIKLTDGFYDYVGKGSASGDQNLAANTTAYRDISKNMNSLMLGLTAGLRLGSFAPDFRARFFLSLDQNARRYTRGNTTSVSTEEGTFSYLLYTGEVGLRFYPLSFLYIRPYLGACSSLASFSFDSFGSKKDNFRDKDGARMVGSSLMFELGRMFPIEVGVDYSQYHSKFGGISYQAMLVLGSSFYLGL